MIRWQGAVKSAFKGQRGQSFLRECAAALDSMPTKRLISGGPVLASGECCAMGAVCLARGLDMRGGFFEVYDEEDDYSGEGAEATADALDIARAMAKEIAWQNDEGACSAETPEERWTRMRKWVDRKIKSVTP
jgi:hypothetical protein